MIELWMAGPNPTHNWDAAADLALRRRVLKGDGWETPFETSPWSDSSGRDPHSARTNRRRSRIDRGPLGGQASMAANGDSDALMVYPSGRKRLLSTGMVVFLVVSAAAPLTAM